MCAVDKLRTQGDTPFAATLGLELDALGDRDETHYPMRPRPIVREADGGRELVEANWGLVPPWAKELTFGRKTFNARAESIAEGKPAFRSAFRHRRCLLVATAYVEYRTEAGRKVPYLFEVDGGAPYAYAGLWEVRDDTFESCAMVTCEPNALAADYHNRMPVILDAADFDAWLDPKADARHLLPLLASLPDERLSARPLARPADPTSLFDENSR